MRLRNSRKCCWFLNNEFYNFILAIFFLLVTQRYDIVDASLRDSIELAPLEENPGSVTKDGLTSSQKTSLLQLHNAFRSIVKPTSSNMLRMSWDDDLESIATKFAAKCLVAHNPDRHKQAKHYDWVGENIAWGTGLCGEKECGDVFEGVKRWFSESKNYNFITGQCSGKCTLYTQMAWWESNKLGCGAKRCGERTILVCNYAPGGNYVGQKPYRQGKPCTDCPKGSICDNQLCVPPDQQGTCRGCVNRTPGSMTSEAASHRESVGAATQGNELPLQRQQETTGPFLLPDGWTKLPVRLIQIDSGMTENIWGLGARNIPYLLEIDNALTQVNGTLHHVSAGESGVWGIGLLGNIFLRMGVTEEVPRGVYWEKVRGNLKQIDSGPLGIVWGVNRYDRVFCRIGINAQNLAGTGWRPIAGELKYISCGSFGCWGVDKQGTIFFRKEVTSANPQGTEWIVVRGSLRMVESGPHGTTVGIRESEEGIQDVLYRAGVTLDKPEGTHWLKMDVKLSHVTVGRRGIMGIMHDGSVVVHKGLTVENQAMFVSDMDGDLPSTQAAPLDSNQNNPTMQPAQTRPTKPPKPTTVPPRTVPPSQSTPGAGQPNANTKQQSSGIAAKAQDSDPMGKISPEMASTIMSMIKQHGDKFEALHKQAAAQQLPRNASVAEGNKDVASFNKMQNGSVLDGVTSLTDKVAAQPQPPVAGKESKPSDKGQNANTTVGQNTPTQPAKNAPQPPKNPSPTQPASAPPQVAQNASPQVNKLPVLVDEKSPPAQVEAPPGNKNGNKAQPPVDNKNAPSQASVPSQSLPPQATKATSENIGKPAVTAPPQPNQASAQGPNAQQQQMQPTKVPPQGSVKPNALEPPPQKQPVQKLPPSTSQQLNDAKLPGMGLAEQLQQPKLQSEQQQQLKPLGQQLQQPKPLAEQLQQPKPLAEQLQQPKPSAEQLQKPKPLAEQLQQPKPLAEQLQQPRPSAEQLQQPKPLAEQPQQPKPLAEQPQQPKPLAEQPQQPKPLAEQLQQPKPLAEQLQQPKLTDKPGALLQQPSPGNMHQQAAVEGGLSSSAAKPTFPPTQPRSNAAPQLATATRPENMHYVVQPTAVTSMKTTPFEFFKNKPNQALKNFQANSNANDDMLGLLERKHMNDAMSGELNFVKGPSQRATPKPIRTAPVTKAVTVSYDLTRSCCAIPDSVCPIPRDCTGYIECKGYKGFYKVCERGKMFHPFKNICDFPRNVDCENIKVGGSATARDLRDNELVATEERPSQDNLAKLKDHEQQQQQPLEQQQQHEDKLPDTFFFDEVPPSQHDAAPTVNANPDQKVAEQIAQPRISTPGGDNAGVLREVWFGLGLSPHLQDLIKNPRFPENPDEYLVLDKFEAPPNAGDGYGQRLSTYFKAPETGNYVFTMACDNECELWVSSDTDELKSKMFMELKGGHYTSFRQWDKYPNEQSSRPIHMEQDKFYFIESFMKEGTGGDNLSIGVRLPDGSKEMPVSNHLFLIPVNARLKPVVKQSKKTEPGMKFTQIPGNQPRFGPVVNNLPMSENYLDEPERAPNFETDTDIFNSRKRTSV